MYEKFFGIDEPPFRLTPDPRYLFLSAKHREALGHLVYGIHEGAGFVAITGEIGAGKTTLLRSLLSRADDTTQYAYILNPVLTGLELLQEINHELGIPSTGTRREMLSALNHFLLDQKRRGRRVVVVIDEAQALDGATLEELRMLSNFETETAKLLQIVLVGQPELRDLLARPELEQLNQRITVRWHLGRLDRDETAKYVAHRVTTAAGGRPRSLFTRGALSQIYAYSRGVPRLINIVCHRSLLVAYANDRTRVTARTVRQAIKEMREPAPARPGRARALAFRAAIAAAVLAIVGTGGVIAWQRSSAPPAAVAGKPNATPSQSATSASATSAERYAYADAETIGEGSGPMADGEDLVDVATAAPVDPLAPGALAAASASPGVTPTFGGREPDLAVERATLANALRQITPGNSAYEATEALLRAWGVPPLAPAEASSSVLDLPQIARARGLEYLPLQGNLTMLRVLDLPAILELVPDDGSGVRFATVEYLGDYATVSVGRTSIDVSPEVLGEAWFGKAHLFWQDLDRLGPMLTLGTSSPAVVRLHELLRAAEVYDGASTRTFAPETEEAVLRFQRSRRLVADGKVGPLTMIALYQAVAGDRLPHLGDVPERVEGDGDRFSALPGGEN
ncbi:MAG TPA: AAA family ATPase [Candidatus Binatia bacterium]